MTYRHALVGDTLLVMWQRPQPPDLLAIRFHLEAACKASGNLPHYIAVTPATAPDPGGDVRNEMISTMKVTISLCKSMHLVLEGSGLKFAARRSIAAGIFLAAGGRTVHVHDQFDKALVRAAIDATSQKKLTDALAEMRASESPMLVPTR